MNVLWFTLLLSFLYFLISLIETHALVYISNIKFERKFVFRFAVPHCIVLKVEWHVKTERTKILQNHKSTIPKPASSHSHSHNYSYLVIIILLKNIELRDVFGSKCLASGQYTSPWICSKKKGKGVFYLAITLGVYYLRGSSVAGKYVSSLVRKQIKRKRQGTFYLET